MTLSYGRPVSMFVLMWLFGVGLPWAQGIQETGSEPFDLVEASREVDNINVTFAVVYKINRQADVTIKWADGKPDKANVLKFEQLKDVPAGIHNTTIAVTTQEPKIAVEIRVERLSYVIYMNNTLEGSLEQRLTPVPTIVLDPPGDIVYQKGEEVTFKYLQLMSSPGKNGTTSIESAISMDVYIYRYTRGTFEKRKGDGHYYFEYTNFRSSADQLAADVKLDSRFYDITGFADYRRAVRDESGLALVREIEVIRRIVIRPSDQTGAFPDQYSNLLTGYDETKDGKFFCAYGQRCQISCSLVGDLNHNQDVQLSKLYHDGRRQHLQFDQTELYEDYAWIGRVNIPAKSCVTMNEREITFECRSRGPYGYVSILYVVYYEPVKIIKEKSGLIWVNDHELKATCAAEGLFPLRFKFWAYYPGLNQFYEANETVAVGDNQVVATAFISSTESQCLDPEIVMGIASKVQCYVESIDRDWNRDKYDMEAPAHDKI